MSLGAEILILDSLERDREGMRALFEKEGFVCSVVLDSAEARALAVQKFFSVAVVDLDFGGVGGGMEIIRYLREHSRATSVIMLSSRRSFEAAVEGLRLGVADIVMKTPREIPRLHKIVLKELDRQGVFDGDGDLLRSVQSVLEEAVKIMLQMGRSLYTDASDSLLMRRPRVLLVDDDESLIEAVRAAMDKDACDLHVEMTGGAALDKASEQPFDMVVAREQLSDLPGSTVLKSIQSYHADTTGLLYSRSGKEGHVDRYLNGQAIDVESPFGGAVHLVKKMLAGIGELQQLQQERRYIRAFRRHHGGFLRRYADLKTRIDGLREDSGKLPLEP